MSTINLACQIQQFLKAIMKNTTQFYSGLLGKLPKRKIPQALPLHFKIATPSPADTECEILSNLVGVDYQLWGKMDLNRSLLMYMYIPSI